jgi:hypothetical protein
MIAGLRNTPKTELDERKITRSIRDAFDAIDSGHPTSPNDLSEAQLLPGIVQDLQNLRLKFEQTVSSSSTKSERQRPLSFDSGCQTDVSVSSRKCGQRLFDISYSFISKLSYFGKQRHLFLCFSY